MIRGENMSKIFKVRSVVVQAFRDHFFANGYYEVSTCFPLSASDCFNVLSSRLPFFLAKTVWTF